MIAIHRRIKLQSDFRDPANLAEIGKVPLLVFDLSKATALIL